MSRLAKSVVCLELLLACGAVSTFEASAGENPSFTFPLHAVISGFEPCDGYLPMDCQSVRPQVTVPPDTTIVVYWLLANYARASGVQTAFQWPADWSLLFGLWFDCVRPAGIPPTSPGNPGGPTFGFIGYSFYDCLVGPGLGVLGRMTFRTGSSGCLSHTVPSYWGGISVMDCKMEMDTIDPDREPARLGSICVGTTGVDACDHLTATTGKTWGAIKATFRK